MSPFSLDIHRGFPILLVYECLSFFGHLSQLSFSTGLQIIISSLDINCSSPFSLIFECLPVLWTFTPIHLFARFLIAVPPRNKPSHLSPCSSLDSQLQSCLWTNCRILLLLFLQSFNHCPASKQTITSLTLTLCLTLNRRPTSEQIVASCSHFSHSLSTTVPPLNKSSHLALTFLIVFQSPSYLRAFNSLQHGSTLKALKTPDWD